ncbi:MAG TPA: sulfatase [Gemmataceae bacterium]|jgi:arylsulfatase A-like enzyme|nr:sulfatase [Gemmataceae bacterium]
MRICIIFAALLAATCQAADKPNVLFIAVDDLNDWVGCLKGHPQVQTPNMDRLAARGTLFANAHCQAPLCNPSRTSVLTGLRPSTTGVYALAPWFRTAAGFETAETLFQYFHRHGYTTLTCGKVFHDVYPPAEARTAGKEVDVWGYHGGFTNRPKTKFVMTPDPNPLVDWGVFPTRDEDQDDWKVADWAIERLKQPSKDPFFLAVGLRHPHVPCFASQKWFDLYPENKLQMPPVKDDDRDDLPRFASYLHWSLPEPRLKWLRENKQWMPLVRSYLASISFVDSQVGRVLDALKASGLEDNTIVVLWSDHGWHLGEKGITGKNTLWERSTHVPLVFAGPGIVRGAMCKRPAELLDLYPTLTALAGLPTKEGVEGHSLVPQLQDSKTERRWPAITTHNQNNHTVRTERWRYIRYADGSEELYDEVADPNEWTNLATDPKHGSTIEELAAWLPKVNAKAVPRSAGRLLEYRDGKVYWEGKEVKPDEPYR